MFANDVYPTRFALAQKKFTSLLNANQNARFALMGFSQRAFLISPLSEDYESLKYLIKNVNLNNISLKGTSILEALKTAKELFGSSNKKALLLFTDGGDQTKFEDEIKFAKENNIIVYIYNIGTTKGAPIKQQNGFIKDKNGNLVIVKLNQTIKNLSLQTKGAYLKHSLNQTDIKALMDEIKKTFKAKEISSKEIKDYKELFYYPLGMAILFFLIAVSSMPRRNDL
jgi:Ca-activated chloride channel family protein